MAHPCSDGLVNKNEYLLREDSSSRLYVLSIMTEQYFKDNKQRLQAEYGPAFASWESVQNLKKSESEYYKMDLDESKATLALTSVVPPGAIAAWLICMQGNSDGLFCYFTRSDASDSLDNEPVPENIFTLQVVWNPPPGLPTTTLTQVTFEIEGEMISEDGALTPATGDNRVKFASPPPTTLLNGNNTFLIRRENNQVYFRGIIKGATSGENGGSYSTNFYMPRYVAKSSLQPNPYYLANNPQDMILEHNIRNQVRFKSVYYSDQVIIKGKNYTATAIGMHPAGGIGYADFKIPKGAQYFSTKVGMSEQSGQTLRGTAACNVYFDGKLVAGTTLVNDGEYETGKIRIPLGAKILRLEVDSMGPINSDHIAWADPHYMSDF